MALMKAVVCTKYGPPDVLQLKEVEVPTPKSNEILVKIFATAVTTSDTIIRGFKVPIGFWLPMSIAIGFSRPRKPILGMVVSGEIEHIGRDVNRFKAGDYVFTFTISRFGGYAEFACLPENEVIAIKPASMSFEEAAAIPYGGMLAMHYLKKGNLQRGQRILVYGASGAVGTAAVQLAREIGAEVSGVCREVNFGLVESLGAGELFDYTKEDFTSGNERYDFIFDAVGKRKSRGYISKEKCLHSLAPSGKYISVDDGSPKLLVGDLVHLKELVEAGKIKPVIDRCYPLEQIVEAHRYVDQGHKKGNVIITVREN